jgi:hypothetical protein
MFFDKPVVCGEAGVVSVPSAIGKKVEGLGLALDRDLPCERCSSRH